MDQVSQRQAVELLEAFLSQGRVESGYDGWPKISLDEFDDLHQLFEAIIDARWGADFEYDAPIRVRLEAREVHHYPASFPIAHVDNGNAAEFYREAVSPAIANVAACVNALNVERAVYEMRLRAEEGES